MSLPWVKLHVPLLDNEDFKRFSDPAKHIYMTLLMLAGKQDKGDYSGRLETATNPLRVSEIAAFFSYDRAVFNAALRQIAAAGFIQKDLAGTIIIARFKEKCAPSGYLSTDRTRAHKERKRNEPGTNRERAGNEPEEEVDSRKKNYDSLRSSALGTKNWPANPEALADLSRIFIERFANTKDPKKVVRVLGPYSSVLASMRLRGVTIEQAWQACEDCWKSGGEVPLFGDQIRRAIFHLQDRAPGKPELARQYPRFARDADGKEVVVGA